MEVADEGDNTGEVVVVEGSRGRRSSRMDWWMGDGMIFGEEREAPKFGASDVSPSLE